MWFDNQGPQDVLQYSRSNSNKELYYLELLHAPGEGTYAAKYLNWLERSANDKPVFEFIAAVILIWKSPTSSDTVIPSLKKHKTGKDIHLSTLLGYW